MDVPSKITYAAQQLRQGHRVNRITVRDFLRHFGAERRGSTKVQAIRSILDSLNLETEPDFETQWIDGNIRLRLKGALNISTENASPEESVAECVEANAGLDAGPLNVEEAERQAISAPVIFDEPTSSNSDLQSSKVDDPTYRIGRLPAANKPLIVVNESDSVTRAISLMLKHDYSQLPVMHGEREVKGVVTWKSICSRLALSGEAATVKDCREEARVVDSNRTLFDAIPAIVEYGYVLVRQQQDRRITGVITASDLSLQFLSLSEPFLLIREVELHVRQLLSGKISAQDVETMDGFHPASSRETGIDDLTFGEYVRLIQHPSIWARLNLKVDKAVLTDLLEEVRLIRNDVMHFDPDPMTPEELDTLKHAVNFMQQLYELS